MLVAQACPKNLLIISESILNCSLDWSCWTTHASLCCKQEFISAGYNYRFRPRRRACMLAFNICECGGIPEESRVSTRKRCNRLTSCSCISACSQRNPADSTADLQVCTSLATFLMLVPGGKLSCNNTQSWLLQMSPEVIGQWWLVTCSWNLAGAENDCNDPLLLDSEAWCSWELLIPAITQLGSLRQLALASLYYGIESR